MPKRGSADNGHVIWRFHTVRGPQGTEKQYREGGKLRGERLPALSPRKCSFWAPSPSENSMLLLNAEWPSRSASLRLDRHATQSLTLASAAAPIRSDGVTFAQGRGRKRKWRRRWRPGGEMCTASLQQTTLISDLLSFLRGVKIVLVVKGGERMNPPASMG